jgi:hypothetical protein
MLDPKNSFASDRKKWWCVLRVRSTVSCKKKLGSSCSRFYCQASVCFRTNGKIPMSGSVYENDAFVDANICRACWLLTWYPCPRAAVMQTSPRLITAIYVPNGNGFGYIEMERLAWAYLEDAVKSLSYTCYLPLSSISTLPTFIIASEENFAGEAAIIRALRAHFTLPDTGNPSVSDGLC